MKKGRMLIGGAAVSAAAGMILKTQKNKRRKYHFLDEFDDKDLKVLPAKLFKPSIIKLMNKQEQKVKAELVSHVKRTALQIESFDKKKIQLYIYEPQNNGGEEKPCFIYYHGGAFYFDFKATYHAILSNYAKYANCKVVGVCYRTMVSDTYLTSLKDCYASLLWSYENAERFGWDRDRIAVGGDSAGGNFAAAVTHYARDFGGPKICYQMLNYPSTDATMATDSMRVYKDTPGWNATLHKVLFEYALPSIDEHAMPYFDLVSQNNMDGLCDAYIEVEEFDCLHDQGQKYAEKLMEHGYSVDFNDVKGTFHAFDHNQELNISKEVMMLRCEMLKKGFTKN